MRYCIWYIRAVNGGSSPTTPAFTVHSFYRRARLSGLWDKILEHLVKLTRRKAGREENPTYALIDSQSVKTTYASDQRSYDGGKKRKAESVTS